MILHHILLFHIPSEYVFFDISLENIVANSDISSKRVVLKTLAKIYDPLGFVSPVTLYAKILFQELCRIGVNWDDNLPPDLLKKWNTWKEDILIHKQFRIQRCYFSRNVTMYSLIGFSDGSMKAYAAVIYLRCELEDGTIASTLVGGKARIAPLEKKGTARYTIPRLELLGCVILTRFMVTVANALRDEIEISETRYYTDSTINLHRIKGVTKEFKQFTQNRLNEIRDKTNVNDWYYVPTKENPSDLASRGCLLSELISSENWLQGPEFIRERALVVYEFQNSTPETEMKHQTLLAVESRKSKLVGSLPPDYFLNISVKPTLANLIDPEKFSTFYRLLCVTAYVCGN